MIIHHYLELLRQHRLQFILLVVATTLAFGLVSTAKLMTSPIYSTAATVSIVPSEAEIEFSTAETTNKKKSVSNLTETYMEYVKSTPVIVEALKKVDLPPETTARQTGTDSAQNEYLAALKGMLESVKRWVYILNYGEYIQPSMEERRINGLRNAINVENITNSHIIKITVNLPDPLLAAQLANALAVGFVDVVSAELSEDALKLEQQLQEEIGVLEDKITSLRAQQKAKLKRYGRLEPNNAEERDIFLAQDQLTRLNKQLLSTRLIRTQGTKIHLVDPAVVPVYPSSPSVLRNTLFGLLTGIVFSLILIVFKDSVSDRIVTSADLSRVAGARSIGSMRRSWIRRKNYAAIRQVGASLERRLAVLGNFDTATQPAENSGMHPAQQLLQEELDLAQDDEAWSEDDTTRNSTALVKVQEMRPVLQVTGIADMATVCWAAVGLAASLASQGREVICRLPRGVVRRPDALGMLEKWKTGKVLFTDSNADDNANGRLTVNCLGPLTADLDLNRAIKNSPSVVCVLPANTIQEDMVQAMQSRFTLATQASLSFMLMG